MLTTLNPNIDLTKDTVCITLEEYLAPVSEKDELNVNIPLLMPNISMGEPKITYVPSKGNSVFLNSSECLPAAKYTVQTINYMTVVCERNSSWEDLYESRVEHKETIWFLPKQTKVQCRFNNGKLTHPTVNTDTFIDE